MVRARALTFLLAPAGLESGRFIARADALDYNVP
jgi:hypothetical protein